jgi:GT2 family glycosyltransferase
MKLSIVIVNYNVRFFLEQCLISVKSALSSIEAEVFVVDNNSQDDSVAMVREKYPWVHLIANKDNPGFSKANNQAIRIAKGEYILLLNPDTVVEENTFNDTLAFMDSHEDAGGLGIKMSDGKGHYLPESKRGLPSPMVALYKILGLSSLFPKSKRFARYYMGHLSANNNQEVEVLAGAFMLMPASVLNEIGLLDEDFFMYGEDVDLSYRITKGGYKNYYFADSSIIHYKGESTKKGSLNYVFIFYKAMVIFAEKHFGGSYAKLFSLVIYFAIYLRAFLAISQRIMERIAKPILDVGFLTAGLLYIKDYWENNHRFIAGGEYPLELSQIAFPIYIFIWLSAVFISGGYDKNLRLFQLIRGIGIGTLIILVGYSLIPEAWRFSRAIIILGAAWAMLILPIWRFLFGRIRGKKVFASAQSDKRMLLVGGPKELERVNSLVKENQSRISYCGWVGVEEQLSDRFVGRVKDLDDLVGLFEVDEVVFCSADMSAKDIFAAMAILGKHDVEIKIAPPASQFIIGSNSIHSQGSWYTMDFNAISKPSNKRAKRSFDLVLALGLLISSPSMVFLIKQPQNFIRNIFLVLLGRKSWVSYSNHKENHRLPKIKKGVIPITVSLAQDVLSDSTIMQLNQLYAKDYRLESDAHLLWQYWRYLGN